MADEKLSLEDLLARLAEKGVTLAEDEQAAALAAARDLRRRAALLAQQRGQADD